MQTEYLLQKHNIVLIFSKIDYKESKLFKDAPQEIIEDLKRKPVTFNYHQFCVTEKVKKYIENIF